MCALGRFAVTFLTFRNGTKMAKNFLRFIREVARRRDFEENLIVIPVIEMQILARNFEQLPRR